MALFQVQTLFRGGLFDRFRRTEQSAPSGGLRLLVIDSSGEMTQRIAQVLSPDVELLSSDSFSDAERALLDEAPDAAVFVMVPCFSMWRMLIEICMDPAGMIPFLCIPRIEPNPPCACPVPCREEDIIDWKLPLTDLQRHINALLEECRVRSPERFRPGRAILPKIEERREPQLDIMS